MSELNYVPSWLDSAMTLLEKLNKCIEKIETIVKTVVTVTKTADDALSLANTNESDITTIQGDITRLDNNNNLTRELTDQALSTANRAETVANSKSPKLYLHEISITIGDFTVKFKKINNESEPISNYEGEAKDIAINGFDFVASGAVSTGKICTHVIGNPHYTIDYAKSGSTNFIELSYYNFAFIDPDGVIFHGQNLYKSGTPSQFTDTVIEL